MGKSKTQKAALGFTAEAKQRAMHDMGFTIFEYDGKINSAPPQLRHIARDLAPGIYIVHLADRIVVKQLDIHAASHKFVYDQASLLHEQFKEVIFYKLQFDYVYALKTETGTFEFTGVLVQNSLIENAVIRELSQIKYTKGYYGVQINGTAVKFVTHVYNVFEDLLLDLAIYSPVSPFKPYVSEIREHRYTELDLQITKFGFSGDAVITLSPAQNGKMVATVVNYPEIDGVEKMFAKAPQMLKLLLELTNPSITADSLSQLKMQAQQIIGEVGT